jgi:hypothetical protein
MSRASAIRSYRCLLPTLMPPPRAPPPPRNPQPPPPPPRPTQAPPQAPPPPRPRPAPSQVLPPPRPPQPPLLRAGPPRPPQPSLRPRAGRSPCARRAIGALGVMTRPPSYPPRSPPRIMAAPLRSLRSRICGLARRASGSRVRTFAGRSAISARWPLARSAPGPTRCGSAENSARSTARRPTGVRSVPLVSPMPLGRACRVRPGVISSERRRVGVASVSWRLPIGAPVAPVTPRSRARLGIGTSPVRSPVLKRFR